MSDTENITAESIPNLDDWGYDDYWSCQQWMQWHKLMVNAWGREKANYRFVFFWDQQTMGAAGYDCRSFNSEFRRYAQEQGFYDALFSGIGVLAKPIGWSIDTAGNILDAAGNVVSGAGNVAKVLKYLLPILVILAVFFVVAYGYKQLKTAA